METINTHLKLRVSTLLVAVLILSGCDIVPNPRERGNKQKEAFSDSQKKYNANDVNEALDDMAETFAHSLKDPAVRSAVQSELARRFDGSFSALYDTLKNRMVGKADFENHIAASFAKVHQTDSGELTESEFAAAKAQTESIADRIP